VKGRFNLFQATMLRWRELHPYSAVHVVRIDRPLDAPRLTAVIDGQLTALGLTGLILDAARARFEYSGGTANTVLAVHAGDNEPVHVVERAIERELNTPFTREGPMNPFRFFVIDSGPLFHLGLTYDHFIAAGDSIVVLMKEIFAGYCGSGALSDHARSPERYPATYRRLFLRHPGPVLRGIRHVRRIVASCRRSVRPRYPGGHDPYNAFAYCRVDPPEFRALCTTAKAWGVTLNDLLMAILLYVLEPLAGVRATTERRRELAVGSIVNLRRDFGSNPKTTFGQFLSSFRVSHPMPPGISLQRLACDIHAETACIKREKLYLQSLMALGVSGVLWRFLSREQRAGFYTKNYPAWGAITMVDVDALWGEAGGRMPPPEYLRAVSTGPLTPMVVAVTTTAGVLHAGISYRTAAFTPADVDRITGGIVACAKRLVP
jgi:hypothetical protein